jgi:hypothetical protein
MTGRTILTLAGAALLVAASVAAIGWLHSIYAAFAIFAACGLIAGLAWPRPRALLVPVAAALGAAAVDIATHRASWGLGRGSLVAVWVAASLPGIVTGTCAIAIRRRHGRVLPPIAGGGT